MKDIRIYYYENGTLHKHNHFKKSYLSIELAKEAIKRIKDYDYWQWVLVEYIGLYNSKIVEIINL